MKYKLKNDKTNKDILELICENRNIDIKNLPTYLNPTKDAIMNPLIYNNMKLACETIMAAINNNLKIGVLVDSDVDGYCSAAMIINYIKSTFKYNNIIIFMHDEKVHGLTPNIMNKISENPVDLLIIPDASSSDYKQHKILKDNGIKTIVIDHHEAERFSKDAIVINNQLNILGNKTLSGGGMVLKVLECLDSINGTNNAPFYYDLAAVAMVGDCMLINEMETKFYVQQGIININNLLLFELYNPTKERNIEMISFDIAPTINAFIRMGDMQDKQDLFGALIGMEGERSITLRGQGTFELPLPEYIGRLASRMKSRQTKAVKDAIENEETIILTEDYPFTICILNNDALKTLTGLIGNRLVEIYRKPAIVLKRVDNGYSGSGRTTDTYEEFRNYIIGLGLFEFALGHQGAFGCKISNSNFDSLLKKIHKSILEEDWDAYVVDKAYENMVSAYEVMAIDELNNYWCKGFEKPMFYIKLTNLKGDEVEVIGQKRDTIRIKHNYITYIKFKCSQEEIDTIKNLNINEVEMIGTFSMNEYNDKLYPQVFIEHLEVKGQEKPKVDVCNIGFGFNNFADFSFQPSKTWGI